MSTASRGFFVKHVHEIWTISKHKDVDVGVAYDMFRTDVRLGKAHDFNTGKALPADYDWAGLSKVWNSYTQAEQIEAYETYGEFAKIYYTTLCRAFEGPNAVELMKTYGEQFLAR